jgi:phage shock protein A
LGDALERTLSALQDDWYRRAELALGKGEEDLAREALKRRKAYEVPLQIKKTKDNKAATI